MSEVIQRNIDPKLAEKINNFIDNAILPGVGDTNRGTEWQDKLGRHLEYIEKRAKIEKGDPDFGEPWNFDVKTIRGKNRNITCSNVLDPDDIKRSRIPYDIVILQIELKDNDQFPVRGIFVPKGPWIYAYNAYTMVSLYVGKDIIDNYTFHIRPDTGQSTLEKDVSAPPQEQEWDVSHQTQEFRKRPFNTTPQKNALGFENGVQGDLSGFTKPRT